MIIAGTGHRTQHIGLGNPTHIESRLFDLAIKALTKFKPKTIISGMALGWDMALAKAAEKLEIPLVAAIPFVGQDSRWKAEQRDEYKRLCDYASEKVVVVTELDRTNMFAVANAMQRRNEYMVDKCDLVLALFNGKLGGTANCIRYANEKDVEIVNLWNSWTKFSGVLPTS